ncbi:MAG: NAD(P)-dependent oxidoreductase [Sphingomonas sp.]|nr:NAD(P)-dependent oxidoreductase [Sphingomonas sp.]
MRILVTGAAGLIGSAVAARLRQDNHVIGLDLRPGPEVGILGDCREVMKWRHQAGALDAIVHVAALHAPHVGRVPDEEFRRVNVEATSCLIDLALSLGCSHFVLTSTTSLYGDALEPRGAAAWIDETTVASPRDIYDETKLEAEQLLTSAGGGFSGATALRMSRCFPEPAGAMAWYRLHRGVDRRDVAEAHALALGRAGAPACFLVSAATPFFRSDCDGLFEDASAVIERRCPGLIGRMTERGWAPPHSIGRVYDCGLARRELGYRPRFGVESCLAGDWDPLPSL